MVNSSTLILVKQRQGNDRRPEHIVRAERDFCTWRAGMMDSFPRLIDGAAVSLFEAQQAIHRSCW
jgi:hypothetical protein